MAKKVAGYWEPLPKRILQIDQLRRELPVKWGDFLERLSTKRILPQSQAEVPVDTGALRSTGRVTRTNKTATGSVVNVTISYGGKWGTGAIGTSGRLSIRKWVDYALIQHEADYSHRVGKKKYLEDPVYQAYPVMRGSLEVETQRLLHAIFAAG